MTTNPHRVATRYLDRTAGDVAEAMATLHSDPKLVQVLRRHPAWREPETAWGELVRDDGAKVGMSGVSGKSWVAEPPRGGTLRGRGGGVRRFKSPSAAILAIEAKYPSR